MSSKTEVDIEQMWLCRKYGVAMLEESSAAFCARRFAAANQKDSARISFSRCRTCTRGAAAYKLAKRKGASHQIQFGVVSEKNNIGRKALPHPHSFNPPHQNSKAGQ